MVDDAVGVALVGGGEDDQLGMGLQSPEDLEAPRSDVEAGLCKQGELIPGRILL